MAFAIALMAKPMLVTLPFVLLLLDWWPLGRLTGSADRTKSLIVEKIPMFGLAAASSVMTFMAQQQGGAVRTFDVLPPGLRLENAVVHTVVYLAQAVWPAHLSVFYPHPDAFGITEVAAALALLIGITALTIWLRRRAPYGLVGWLWYLGMLVPVIGVIQVGRQAGADRYTYLPLVGIFIAMVWGASDALARVRVRRVLLPAATAFVIVACVVTARAQVEHWRSNSALWSNALASTLGVDDRRAEEAVAALAHPDGQVDPQVATYLRLKPAGGTPTARTSAEPRRRHRRRGRVVPRGTDARSGACLRPLGTGPRAGRTSSSRRGRHGVQGSRAARSGFPPTPTATSVWRTRLKNDSRKPWRSTRPRCG